MNSAQILQHHTARLLAAGAQPVAGIPMPYRKVRFTSSRGSTAGIVVEAPKLAKMSISEVSRLFPVSESRFMSKIQTSPEFLSWDEAFAYEFPA